MINKSLITLVILFAITGCDSSQQQSAEKDGFFFKLNSFFTISTSKKEEVQKKEVQKEEVQKEEPKYHAQCSIGNIAIDEIVTKVNEFGTRVYYVNSDGKNVLYANNCKFTQL